VASEKEEKIECRGRAHGWDFCPWVLSGAMAYPMFRLNRKLSDEGHGEAAEKVGIELAKMLILLDKLFITVDKEEGLDLVPGFEVWIRETYEAQWSPDDCFCTKDMTIAPFKHGEKELLTQLWAKSRVLHDGTVPGKDK
jgi:hypothetical protein